MQIDYDGEQSAQQASCTRTSHVYLMTQMHDCARASKIGTILAFSVPHFHCNLVRTMEDDVHI